MSTFEKASTFTFSRFSSDRGVVSLKVTFSFVLELDCVVVTWLVVVVVASVWVVAWEVCSSWFVWLHPNKTTSGIIAKIFYSNLSSQLKYIFKFHHKPMVPKGLEPPT